MLQILKSADRGYANHGWLESRFSFSFADYYNPETMGFRHLRVINDDFIQPGMGFGTHPHRDMEIITYVLAGALAHKDSMGNGSTIIPGNVQKMSAGTGISHSEFNPSDTEVTHSLQIWILPDTKGLKPVYQEMEFPLEKKLNRLCLVGSDNPDDGVIHIRQDVQLYVSVLDPGHPVTHPLGNSRYAWLHVISGELSINGEPLFAGDGVAVQEEESISMDPRSRAEFLLFDMG